MLIPKDIPCPGGEILNFLFDNINNILNCHISENVIMKWLKTLKKIKHVLMMVL